VIDLNGSAFITGDSLTATFRLNQSITRPFTVFAVIMLPNGQMLNARTLNAPLEPLASHVPRLNAPFRFGLIAMFIPSGAPKGEYEIAVVFFDALKPYRGRVDAFLDASAKFTIQ
jgi:hypothetical protein